MLVWGGEINGTPTNTGALYRPPNLGLGMHAGIVTLTPDQGPPVTLEVRVTVLP